MSTSPEWSNVSGLASLLLARYDSGSRNFNVHDPGNLNERLIRHCITFDTKLKRFKFNYISDNLLNDQILTLRSVLVRWQNSITTVYLGRLAQQPGQVNLEKCFRLKVPRQLVVELENNRKVMSETGQIVRPEDVCDAASPEQHFAIFECRHSADYLDWIETQEEIQDVLPRLVLSLI